MTTCSQPPWKQKPANDPVPFERKLSVRRPFPFVGFAFTLLLLAVAAHSIWTAWVR